MGTVGSASWRRRGRSSRVAGVFERVAAAQAERGPGICDFTFGNPQEMPLPGFVARSTPCRTAEQGLVRLQVYRASSRGGGGDVAFGDWRGSPFEPEDIAMTTGAFGALRSAFRALMDPGDEVVIPLPGLVPVRTDAAVRRPVPVKVRARPEATTSTSTRSRRRSRQDPDVMVNTPHNPTGRIYPRAALDALADLLSPPRTRGSAPDLAPLRRALPPDPFRRIGFTSPAAVYPGR